MKLQNAPNLNYLWSQLIVEELIRLGADYFCVAPGSRSSPLALSIAAHKQAKVITHFDERGLAFHALGYSSATGKPSVILTTSGTAVANLWPAIVEASKKKVPLIILTADRPVELRQTGAHQTINQLNIFGDNVRYFFDLPVPTNEIEPSFVLTTIDQAVARSQGGLKGPVHLNCPFREPLTPVKVKMNIDLSELKTWERSAEPFTVYTQNESHPKSKDLSEIAEKINTIKNGLIVVGKLSKSDQQNVIRLSEKLNWPIFPDGVSGLRLGNTHKNVIHYFDQILLNKKLKFDGILHFGGRITSKRFYELLNAQNLKHYIMVLNHPLRNDPFHNVSVRVQDSAAHFCQEMVKRIKTRKANALLKSLSSQSQKIDRVIDQEMDKSNSLNEVFVARTISTMIPSSHNLFLSNSLPIREIDMYASPNGDSIAIGSNRGASGIDGIIASAIGMTNGSQKPTTLLIGDLAFLHDLNSLAMLTQTKTPLQIVVLNNGGGGIFNFLPIASSDKNTFEKYFATSHNLSFAKAAELFDLDYLQPKTKQDFVSTYQKSLSHQRSTLIEVVTNRYETVQLIKSLQQKIAKI